MHRNTNYWQSIVVVLAAFLALTVAPTTSSAQSFTIIAPDTAKAQTGMTYNDWSAVWWQWDFSGIHLRRDTIYHNGFRPLKPRASIGGHSGRF